jgi:hypothetical protein
MYILFFYSINRALPFVDDLSLAMSSYPLGNNISIASSAILSIVSLAPRANSFTFCFGYFELNAVIVGPIIVSSQPLCVETPDCRTIAAN